MDQQTADSEQRLHEDLGLGRLSPLWAKAEIFLGLAVVAVALLDPFGLDILIRLPLFVLGGYLAMAGHRSHLYQSNNKLAAWLHATRHSTNMQSP